MAMSTPRQKVQVFSLGRPRAGSERAQRRHYVKWRVDGRDRTRAFKTRAEADRFRSGLLVAVRDGQRFDVSTGMRISWLENTGAPTWWSWSQEWLAFKWPQWSGHSRRSGVESLTLLTPLLVKDAAPTPPADLADWLRTVAYRAGATPTGPSADWLSRWSIPLADRATWRRPIVVLGRLRHHVRRNGGSSSELKWTQNLKHAIQRGEFDLPEAPIRTSLTRLSGGRRSWVGRSGDEELPRHGCRLASRCDQAERTRTGGLTTSITRVSGGMGRPVSSTAVPARRVTR